MELEDEEMINGCQQYWKISGKKVEMAAGATIKATLDLLPSELIKKYSFLKRPIQIVSVVCGRNYEPLINFE
ncbi:hypothetical protein SNEBB_007206 [Seison nebaliae]|nr:hypothetical protein SNEBB_007206 [Seison nebaliae]